ncbi:MAG TPA: hypothetical protein VGM53_20300 [Streptosporangiaceae bacterium]
MAPVGGNGAGKSTLVKLLLRFYDPGTVAPTTTPSIRKSRLKGLYVGSLSRMRYSRRDSGTESSPKRYARLRRGGTYWTGLVFAVVLFGVGIAGLVFGHRYAGGFGVLVGGVGLLAGARDWSRRRYAARPGRIPQLSLRRWPPPSVHVVLVLGYPRHGTSPVKKFAQW